MLIRGKEMIEFTKEQEEYLNSNINHNVFLEACPGSGKTEVVAAKVAQEIESWKNFPGGIASLSFANSATDELITRVKKYLPTGRRLFPHFVGTFDSFIFKNIVNPLAKSLTKYNGKNGDFSIRIVDKASRFFGYRTEYGIAGKGKISAHHFSFKLPGNSLHFDSGEPILDKFLNNKKLENWQVEQLTDSKSKMWAGGFATYADILYLTVQALSGKNDTFVQKLAKRFPLIIVDECQDLSSEHLLILERLNDIGVKLHFIGDLHQAIYGFRDVNPSFVQKFTHDHDFLNLKLTRNFRSCQKIIDVCGKLTGREGIVGQRSSLNSSCHLLQYNKCPTEIINNLKAYYEEYDNVVLVSRGYSILSKFSNSNSNLKPLHKLAVSVRDFYSEDNILLEDLLTNFSEFLRAHLDESVKPNSYNCPQSIESNLVWRKFLFFSLRYICEKKIDINLNWSKWSKAMTVIIQNLNKQKFINDDIKGLLTPLEQLKLRAPQGQSKEVVKDTLGEIKVSDLISKKMTIHSSKGQTHDVTILVSTADARGSASSNWKDWLNDPASECARFAYVASSRPKHNLVWVVKKLNQQEREKFTNLGFHII